jgi:hypothetical protein
MKLLGVLKLACLLCIANLPDLVRAQFIFTTNDDAITISGYNGAGGTVDIPSTINGLPVTSIGTNAFEGCPTLTNVIIPCSVAALDDEAFYFCGSLTTVCFQGNAPSLGSQVFGTLETIIGRFPQIVTVYPNCFYLPGATGWDSTFGGCPTFLYSSPYICTLTNSTITIDSYAGDGGAVVIPGTMGGLPVTAIANEAFSGSDLTSIAVPNSVITIGDDAFVGCVGLTNITLPNSGNMSIGNWAFLGCTSLTSVTIPNGVNNIGYYAFGQCTSLTNVIISSSVLSIREVAFLGCSNLTSVYFAGNAPSADFSVFTDDNYATIYYLPGTMGWGPTFGGSPTALWWLPYPLILNSVNFGVQANGFGFIISWATNNSVVVDSCTNLVNPVWYPVSTNALTGGSSYFNDLQWTNFSARYYRLRSQ